MTYLDLVDQKNQVFFFDEFKLFIKEQKENKNILYELLEKGLENWAQLFDLKEFDRAPQLFSMFSQIKKDTSLYNVPSGNRLNVYNNYLKYEGLSFFDELTLILLNIFEENEKGKWKAKNYNTLIYTIFSKIRYQLYQKIRLSIRKHNQVILAEDIYANKYSFDNLPTYKHVLLYELESNIWRKYLASLINQGYSLVERSKLTHIDRSNLQKEEGKILWKWLKQQLYNN